MTHPLSDELRKLADDLQPKKDSVKFARVDDTLRRAADALDAVVLAARGEHARYLSELGTAHATIFATAKERDDLRRHLGVEQKSRDYHRDRAEKAEARVKAIAQVLARNADKYARPEDHELWDLMGEGGTDDVP